MVLLMKFSIYFRRYYEAHLTVHDKEWKCQFCNKQFMNGYAMRVHMKTHVDEPVTCEECGKIYKNKFALQTHKHTSHNKNPVHCEYCNKQFNYKTQLNKHLLAHSDERQYVCDICGIKCKTNFSVQRHVRVVHQENKIDRRIATATVRKFRKKTIKCRVCSSDYTNPIQLKKHMKDEHEFGLKLWEEFAAVVCFKCMTEFSSSEALRDHRQLVHQVQCNICKRYVSCEATLANHMKNHKGDRHFKCEVHIYIINFNINNVLIRYFSCLGVRGFICPFNTFICPCTTISYKRKTIQVFVV